MGMVHLGMRVLVRGKWGHNNACNIAVEDGG
jgi:hypothetical protein